MIEIKLGEDFELEDVNLIMKLRNLGVPDEVIQTGYNNTLKKRREQKEKELTDITNRISYKTVEES